MGESKTAVMTYREAIAEAQRRNGVPEDVIKACAEYADRATGFEAHTVLSKQIVMQPGITEEAFIQFVANAFKTTTPEQLDAIISELNRRAEKRAKAN